MSDNLDQVPALIKELLSLNRSERAPMAHPPSAEELEQRQSKRKRVRQELVLALSPFAAYRDSCSGTRARHLTLVAKGRSTGGLPYRSWRVPISVGSRMRVVLFQCHLPAVAPASQTHTARRNPSAWNDSNSTAGATPSGALDWEARVLD
jgi:hypothetical protein